MRERVCWLLVTASHPFSILLPLSIPDFSNKLLSFLERIIKTRYDYNLRCRAVRWVGSNCLFQSLRKRVS